jgi:hypothetical protein
MECRYCGEFIPAPYADACGPGSRCSERRWVQLVKRKQAEIERLRWEVAVAMPVMRDYARNNPRHDYQGEMQDPNGVHAWLARNDQTNSFLDGPQV